MGKAVDRVDEEFSVFDVTVRVRQHAREFCPMLYAFCATDHGPRTTDSLRLYCAGFCV